MGKLWDKGEALDALIESFTVGEDYLLDNNLGGPCPRFNCPCQSFTQGGLLNEKEL